MPEDRTSRFLPEFGFAEPTTIPMGKCSIRQALKFIDNHQQDPQKITAENIASEYTLDAERVKNILKYYKMYEVQLPKKDSAEISSAEKFKYAFSGAGKTFIASGEAVKKDEEDVKKDEKR